jgi:fructose-1,6-bisphosphatase I
VEQAAYHWRQQAVGGIKGRLDMGNLSMFGQPLAEFLGESDLGRLLATFADAGVVIARRVALGPLGGNLSEVVGANSDGDAQKALDVHADEVFVDALRSASVRGVASEEREAPVWLDPEGAFLVAIDPLDGSSNIETNVTVGSLLAILDAAPAPGFEGASFLQPGHRQRAAAILLYGPCVEFVFSLGAGTHVATLDPATGGFRMTKFSLVIPEGRPEFAINASNARHWPEPVQSYVADLVMGESGPRVKQYNMRWIAAVAADAYRVLIRGGSYLYPDDSRVGYRQGRLRLLYEANPIALLIEQAGGMATDGVNRILDIAPTGLHQRTPLIFGSADKVERIRSYYIDGHRSASRAPLFGKRGLLR